MPNVLKARGNCYRQDFNNVAYGFHWWSDQKQFLMQVKQIFYQYPTYVTTHSAHLSWTARPPQGSFTLG
jgi:hypothetical protein